MPGASATGGGTLASYYCGRNFVLVWAKNMPGALARRFWPALLREANKQGVKYHFIEDEHPEAEKQIPVSLEYLERLKL